MLSHRIERLQSEFLKEVRTLLLFDLNNEPLGGVSVTRVVLTKDLSVARVYYEIAITGGVASEQRRHEVQMELHRCRGGIRKELAHRLRLRSIPKLEFFYDETSETISRVERLIDSL